MIAFITIFKFMQLNAHIMVLWDTLAAAGSKLVVLFLVIFFITTGFAIQGSLLFGHRNAAFCTMSHSFVTLFRSALGDFNFEELTEVNPKAGAAYFMIYQLIQGLVILNMFIAVISEAYEQVKEERDNHEGEDESNLLYLQMTDLKRVIERQDEARQKESQELAAQIKDMALAFAGHIAEADGAAKLPKLAEGEQEEQEEKGEKEEQSPVGKKLQMAGLLKKAACLQATAGLGAGGVSGVGGAVHGLLRKLKDHDDKREAEDKLDKEITMALGSAKEIQVLQREASIVFNALHDLVPIWVLRSIAWLQQKLRYTPTFRDRADWAETRRSVRAGFSVCHKHTEKLLDDELYEILAKSVAAQDSPDSPDSIKFFHELPSKLEFDNPLFGLYCNCLITQTLIDTINFAAKTVPLTDKLKLLRLMKSAVIDQTSGHFDCPEDGGSAAQRISRHTRRNFRIDLESTRLHPYDAGRGSMLAADVEVGKEAGGDGRLLSLKDGILRALKAAPAPDLATLIPRAPDRIKFQSGSPLAKEKMDARLLQWNLETLVHLYNREFPLKTLEEEQHELDNEVEHPGDGTGVKLALDELISISPAGRKKGQKLSGSQVAYLMAEKERDQEPGDSGVSLASGRDVAAHARDQLERLEAKGKEAASGMKQLAAGAAAGMKHMAKMGGDQPVIKLGELQATFDAVASPRMTTTFGVAMATADGCGAACTRILKKMDGVEEIAVDIENKTVIARAVMCWPRCHCFAKKGCSNRSHPVPPCSVFLLQVTVEHTDVATAGGMLAALQKWGTAAGKDVALKAS
jgi:hypothetical protein